MDTIVLEVDAAIARAFNELTPEKQQKIQADINQLLGESLQVKTLQQIMAQASAEAAANGLTQEILDAILADED